MFIPETRALVLQIPKCASNTLTAGIERRYGKCKLPGHMRLSEMVRQARLRGFRAGEAVAVIRDPLDRFLSALNHVYGDSAIELDDALNGALRNTRTITFKPQSWFVDCDWPIRLFAFEDIGGALAHIGYEGEPLHRNRSVKRWTLADLDYRMDEISGFTAVDEPLRARVA